MKQQFLRVANSNRGMYALIDYVNFKGEGTLPTERYHDQGWGLRQVLLGMHGEGSKNALKDFMDSAAKVLAKRVANAPKDRHEEQWLPGWMNRLHTYLQ